MFHARLFKYGEWISDLLKNPDYEHDLEFAEEFAEDLYLAVITISGFLNEFSYASDFLKGYICSVYVYRTYEKEWLLPLWGKERWVQFVCIA